MRTKILIKYTLVWIVTIAIMYFCCAPFISAYSNAREQNVALKEYKERVEKDYLYKERNKVDKEIEKARELNKIAKPHPILDPWQNNVENNPEYQEYMNTLDFIDVTIGDEKNSIMGFIQIPKIGVNHPIYHGFSDNVLNVGVGHLFGSSYPVGGENSLSVFTGHTGMPNKVVFDKLVNLEINDAIYLNVGGIDMKYVVSDIQVVEPDDVDKIVYKEEKDQIALITCTPYGINSHRIILTADRMPFDFEEGMPEIGVKPETIIGKMWGLLALGISVFILVIIWTIYDAKQMRKIIKTIESKQKEKTN